MKWLRGLLTPDERKVLLYLAAVLLLGSALHVAGVYRQRRQGVDSDLHSALINDTPLLYDLRTVTRQELLTVPGIGPVTADRILAWRTHHSPARRSDLLEVHGIGSATFERLAPYFRPLSADDTLTGPVPHERDLPVDINRADEQLLATLPGIGARLAAAIVTWRDSAGPIRSVDQLDDVPGIGPRTLEQLRPHIYTGDPR